MEVTHQEIISSKLPDGAKWIAVTHSHPHSEVSYLNVYNSSGTNTHNRISYLSEGDVLYGAEHGVMVAVSLLNGLSEIGYLNQSYALWQSANANSRFALGAYRGERDYIFHNVVLTKGRL